MKALLVLALIFAAASALYEPKWSRYATSAKQFNPISVTSSFPPGVNQYNTVTVCGQAQVDFQVTSFTYQVGRGSTIWYSGTVNEPPQMVFSGAYYCYSYTFLMPSIAAPNFTVYLTLQNPQTTLGTVQVDFA